MLETALVFPSELESAQRLTQLRHWHCTAAMFLMSLSGPIKVLD
jgi:hypothetical protein